MNALIEFAALARSHPGPGATVDQVAAWYEAKGQLHEHLAATVTPAEAAAELANAAAAYEHARRLTARQPAADLATVDVTVGGAS